MRAELSRAGVPALAVATANGGLRLTGALVFATAAAALDALFATLPASGGSLAVDLSGIERSDSAGLAALVEWRAEGLRRGVHLRYSGASVELRALARLADLDAELFA